MKTEVMAALRNLILGLLRQAGEDGQTAALRYYGWIAREALSASA